MKKYEIVAAIHALIGDVPGLHRLSMDEARALWTAILDARAAVMNEAAQICSVIRKRDGLTEDVHIGILECMLAITDARNAMRSDAPRGAD